MVESRPGPRGGDEHARGEGSRRAVRRRSVERRLETFRTARGIHQSEARATVAIRDAAIRAAAVGYWSCLFVCRRVPCQHFGGGAAPTRNGEARTAAETPAPAQRACGVQGA